MYSNVDIEKRVPPMREGSETRVPEYQRGVFHRLTEIDLSDLQIGERLTIYRGSNSFLTGPGAAGYVGEAVVTSVKNRSAALTLELNDGISRQYRLRFKDGRICRVPNGETTMLYVHARTGRPTMTAYFTDNEYEMVKALLRSSIAESGSSRVRRISETALERMEWHDARRAAGTIT